MSLMKEVLDNSRFKVQVMKVLSGTDEGFMTWNAANFMKVFFSISYCKELFLYFKRNLRNYKIPFFVYTTSITFGRRRIDVKTTACRY